MKGDLKRAVKQTSFCDGNLSEHSEKQLVIKKEGWKCKVVPFHVMKVYRRSRSVAPLILQLSARWKWVTTQRHSRLLHGRYPSTHWIGGCVGPRASLDILKNRQISQSKLYKCVNESFHWNILWAVPQETTTSHSLSPCSFFTSQNSVGSVSFLRVSIRRTKERLP